MAWFSPLPRSWLHLCGFVFDPEAASKATFNLLIKQLCFLLSAPDSGFGVMVRLSPHVPPKYQKFQASFPVQLNYLSAFKGKVIGSSKRPGQPLASSLLRRQKQPITSIDGSFAVCVLTRMLPLQLATRLFHLVRILHKSPLQDEWRRERSLPLYFLAFLKGRGRRQRHRFQRISPERSDNEIMGDKSSAFRLKRSCKRSPAEEFSENASLIQLVNHHKANVENSGGNFQHTWSHIR